MKKILASLLSLALTASSAQAVPQVLNFQGRLSESGSLSNGNRQITFGIYASQTGGAALFTETRTITVSSGIFNALIGEGTTGGIPLPVFDGNDRYVEVRVGTTVLPRQKMASVAHAYVAAVAQSLAVGATIQFNVISASSATIADLRITGELSVGEGTVHVRAINTAQGLTNTITFTPVGSANTPQIRTSLAGNANINSSNATGALSLIVNAGATGNLLLNPFTSGNILLAKSTVTNTGAFVLAPNASLSMFGPTGTITTGSSVTASAFFGTSVDAQSASFGAGVNKSLFDTTGALTFPAGYTPTAPQNAATKAYVDSQAGGGIWTKTGSVVTLTNPADNVVVQSTLTVKGNEFSVGASLLNVSGSNVGIGTTSPATKLDVAGNAQFGSGAAKSTFTATGALLLANNSGIQLSGPSGTITTASSVTASGFFGDGSGLTGVSATQVAASNVTPGTFVSGVNLPATGVLPGSLGSTVIASSVAVSAVSNDQVAVGANIDQAKVANLIPNLAAKVSKAGDTMTGALNMSNVSVNLAGPAGNVISQASVTASAFFGDGSNLTGVSASQVAAANVTPGTFLAGVNLPATGVLPGSLGNTVIASSIAVSAISDNQVAVGANITQSKIANLTSDLAAKVAKAGDTMTGALNMSNVAVSLTGPAGNVISQASMTASAFFGDGSNLTGVSASQVAAANVTPGTFVSGVNLPATGVLPGSLGNAVIASSIAVSAISNDQVAAGANIAQSKIVSLTSDLASKVSKAGDTMTGALNMNNAAVNLTGPTGNVVSQASVSASGFFGDGSGLTGVTGPWTKTGQIVALTDPTNYVVVQTTLTVQGGQFSVGGSLLSVAGGNVGVGTASPGTPLDVAGTVRMTGFNLPPGAASGLVLTSDVSGNGTWQPAAGGGGAIPTNMQVFNSNGPFTVPTGVTRIVVDVWGGGGGGGSSNNLGTGGGGGGGGGGYGRQFFTVTPGAVISVTIGAGGTASNFNPGGSGGATSFGALLSATGGTGGAAAQSLGGGASGGTGGTSIATFNISGGTGGGSGTGSSGAVANAIASGAMGGAAGNGGAGGGGGRAVYFSSPAIAAGRPGVAPGGGGGGGAGFDTNAGGAGAPGRVLVTW